MISRKLFVRLLALIFFLLNSTSCFSPPDRNVVYQVGLNGIQDGDILVAGTTRYVFVNAKGVGDLKFTWEDSSGIIPVNESDSAINYVVPSIEGENYIKVTVKSGENGTPITRVKSFKVLVPPSITASPSAVTITTKTETVISPEQTGTPTNGSTSTATPTLRPPDNILYTVKAGDTLVGISRLLFGSIAYADEMAKSNCIENYVIYPDQKIELRIVTIQRGDVLSLIAEKYSLTSEDLMEINDEITSPSLIYAGQLLFLPVKNCP